MTFEEALKDVYCRKIMNSFNKWMPKVSKQEIRQLQLIALWEATRTFDATKSKFTTHLYNRLRFKYLKYINSKKNRLGVNKEIWYSKKELNLDSFFDGVSYLTRVVIEDRFIYKLSLKEMAKKYNVKYSEVKKMIHDAKEELRSV